ncbi:hypothetical protein CAOG_03251 [Capsaspora owczarzaki ATCC 30864]|uniref:PPPDE domain-containing protein n=1 Tax=Capsaspora owczarzaki (strain ATCC 30864) TaxID=595528 RepID=A0A0D2VP93_CAPO3|nr:hypothetical protein CAOG_03251 [Capsaspora owczarzaki ATCC 30864]KJE92247.1 hypothetical protein CAOG_003251 [Capsaspora owczarzaki ATCC 30864]|eukprot:XP_004364090.2 hypothetical protein CAOG_03251 [Capsaspora owczarzaki ATCC 30864]
MSSSVVLYVYDLSRGMASQFSSAYLGRHLDGIWHTSIVVYGEEYYFGAGIQTAQPGRTMHGQPLRQVDLGVTAIPRDVFHDFLRGLSDAGQFSSTSYHLLDQNCNHFTQECAQFLVARDIPSYIRSLPDDFASTPMGAMLRPLINSFFTSGQAVDEVPFRSMAGQQPGGAAAPTPTATGTATAQPLRPHTFDQLQLSTIMTKLRGFLDTNRADATQDATIMPLTNALAAQLDSLEASLTAVPTPATTALIGSRVKANGEHVALFTALLQPYWPLGMIEQAHVATPRLRILRTEQLFPVLDLLRVWLLADGAIALVSNPLQNNCIPHLLAALVTGDGAVFSSDAAQLVVLRAACNMFASDTGAKYMLSDSAIAAVVNATVTALLNPPRPVIRQTAATLAFNIALSLGSTLSEVAASAVAELTTAIHHILAAPATAQDDEESVFRGLSALLQLVSRNEDSKQLVIALGFDTILSGLRGKSARLATCANQLAQVLG